MKILFFLVCIIGIVIQIKSITSLKKLKDSKYWNILIGINVASLISIFLAFNILGHTDISLSELLLYWFLYGFLLIVNIIILIVGLISKKKMKNIKLNKNSIFVGLIVILLSVLLLIIIPATENSLLPDKILNYLNNKYGDNDFEIVKIEKHYLYEGIINKRFDGYEIKASSSKLKDNIFIVYASENNYFTDEFVSKYYDEKINDFLKKKYNFRFDFEVNEGKIPNNYKRIPTFDELLGYDAISDVFIIDNKGNIYEYDENEKINYLKELSIDLINYLNISKKINIEFQIWSSKKACIYNIQISNNNIKITSDNNKVYEFNIK